MSAVFLVMCGLLLYLPSHKKFQHCSRIKHDVAILWGNCLGLLNSNECKNSVYQHMKVMRISTSFN